MNRYNLLKKLAAYIHPLVYQNLPSYDTPTLEALVNYYEKNN